MAAQPGVVTSTTIPLINLGYLRPGTRGEPFNVPTDATNYAFDI